jgi:hypothetical protein
MRGTSVEFISSTPVPELFCVRSDEETKVGVVVPEPFTVEDGLIPLTGAWRARHPSPLWKAVPTGATP